MINYTFTPDRGDVVRFDALNDPEAQTIAAARFHGIPGTLTRQAAAPPVTYRIGVTLEVESSCSDAGQVRHDIGGAVSLLQKVRRNGTTITHAWMQPQPRELIHWCEKSSVPVDECVGCQRGEN